MPNAVYLVNYTGQAGIGAATLVFLNGQIFGADVAGGEYSGDYQQIGDKLTGTINLYVPAGVQLVTGTPISNQPYTVPIPFSFPSGLVDQQKAETRVELPTGPVNAIVKKIKSLAA